MAANKKQKTPTKRAAHSKEPFMIVTDSGQLVKKSVLEQFAIKAQDSQQIVQDNFTDIYAEKELMQPLYNPLYLMNLADVNTFYDAALETRANDICGLGWKLKPIGDNPSETNQTTLMDFFNRVMLENPFKRAQRDKDEIGYAMLELVRLTDDPTSQPYNIFHLPAHTMRIHRKLDKFCQTRGSEYQWFRRLGKDNLINNRDGQEFSPESLGAMATEVMYNMHYTSRSSYYGRPPIIPAIRAVMGNLSAMEFNIAFFSNYGVPTYAVFITGNYEDGPVDPKHPDGETKLQRAVREKFSQVQSNPHSSMVFSVPSEGAEGKVEIRFERLSTEVKEASFTLFKKDNRDEVITAMRIDPHRLNTQTTGALGGDTAKISRQNYLESVQKPEQTAWENLINHDIIQAKDGFDIQDWCFRFEKFDIKDRKEEADRVKIIFDIGGLTPNQIIRKYGKDFGAEESDNPYMDMHYVNNKPVEEGPTEKLNISQEPNIAAQNVTKMLDTMADEIEATVKKENKKGLLNRIKGD